MIPASEWNSSENGPISLATIQLLHQPAGHFRVSASRYPPGTRFPGASRAGRLYVLSGACIIAGKQWECHLIAGEFADIPAGEYQFQAHDTKETALVRVWELPKEFWKSAGTPSQDPPAPP